MNKVYRKGATGALLDEYEKAVTELQQVIRDIPDHLLVHIADPLTSDDNCRSVQTVLAHVVSSAYSYAIYIQDLYHPPALRPEKKFRTTAADFEKDLSDAFLFTTVVFENIKDSELEEKKIAARWGQAYDIEQYDGTCYCACAAAQAATGAIPHIAWRTVIICKTPPLRLIRGGGV